jgi:hypothetical protein
MKATQIKKATKQMTFNEANEFIKSLGFELVLIQNLPFAKMWEVKNNTEFSHISNTLKGLENNLSMVKFAFLN